MGHRQGKLSDHRCRPVMAILSLSFSKYTERYPGENREPVLATLPVTPCSQKDLVPPAFNQSLTFQAFRL